MTASTQPTPFLVTGALGCIGAWVVSRLLDRGDVPVVFDMGTDPRRIRDLVGEDKLDSIRFVQGDIADPAALQACVETHGIQRIVHLAGLQVPFCRADPMLGARVNVLGTVNVFEVAAKAGIDRIAYASSAAVFEREDEVRSQGAPNEDATPHPNTHYGVYKLANEGTARVSHMEHGISSMGLRPLTVYGVGRDQGMTSGPTKAIKSAVIGQPYTIGFAGRTDFLYAGDCADAFIAAAERGPDGASVFNLAGAATEVTSFVGELASQVDSAADLIKVEGTDLPVPGAIAGGRLDDALPGLARTSLSDGIRDTLQRFRALHDAGQLSTSDLANPTEFMGPRITKVETALLRVPLGQRQINDSQSKVDAVEFLTVRLHTDAGVIGVGTNWSYTPGLRAAQVMVEENYAPVLIGKDVTLRKAIIQELFLTNHFVGRVGASRVGIAAVEFALWDAVVKRAGVPLWHYLGAARDKVLAYSTDGGWLDWSQEDLVRDATALIDRGFHAVKIKLGRKDPSEDYDRIGAVRDAVGPKIRIMTDVNCAWTLNIARYWGGKLADHDVFWLEEPMVPENIKAHAELQRAIQIPVAVGETIFTKYAFRDYIEQGAVGIVQADATKLLGIDEWLEVAALAGAHDLPIVPHTNVQQKLHAQLAAATPHCPMLENCYESIKGIWVEPIDVVDGYYQLPNEPGVGLELNEETLAKYTIAKSETN